MKNDGNLRVRTNNKSEEILRKFSRRIAAVTVKNGVFHLLGAREVHRRINSSFGRNSSFALIVGSL